MNYRFSNSYEDMDLDLIHDFLVKSYWANGILKKVVKRAIQNSFCFGLFVDEGQDWQQIAFGRFVTDSATFAYLADVFVLPKYRGQGLARSMLRQALEAEDLQGLRRIMLATRDAHGLYSSLGFDALDDPEIFMQLWEPDVYKP